jgi:hypothetical protein
MGLVIHLWLLLQYHRGHLHEHHYLLTDLLPWQMLLVYPPLRRQHVRPHRLGRVRQATPARPPPHPNTIGDHRLPHLHLHIT